MKRRNLISAVLAGVMVIGGSIGAYASENNTPVEIVPAVKIVHSSLSEQDKGELEKMKKMTQEELQEYIKINNPKVVPMFKCTEAEVKKAVNFTAAKLINSEAIEKINFENLSQEVQERLIERYGENAKNMIFASEEMAKKAADGELEKQKIIPAMKVVKYSLSEEDKAELEKMKNMTPEELQEYIKENNPKVVPMMKVQKAKIIEKTQE